MCPGHATPETRLRLVQPVSGREKLRLHIQALLVDPGVAGQVRNGLHNPSVSVDPVAQELSSAPSPRRNGAATAGYGAGSADIDHGHSSGKQRIAPSFSAA